MVLTRQIRILCLVLCLILQGCASSSVSRDSARDVDSANDRWAKSWNKINNSDISSAYENSSQAVKGALIGGAAGAVTAGMVSGVGLGAGAAVGAIGGAALGSYLEQHMTLVDQLENRGVQVIVLGDQVMLVIPSVFMFVDNTAQITTQGYSTLDLVAELIRGYTKMSVGIAAYTSDAISAPISMALTRQQSQNIEKYLWYKNVDTRFMYAVAGGSTRLVEKTTDSNQNGANYRVEITLEKLPV